MSTVALDRSHGITATTELLVLEPVSQRLGLEPIVLAPGEIGIGSGPECEVRLDFPGIAARHCVLSCSRNRVALRALDRRTWINSLPLLEGRLKAGDRLAVGPVEFRVRKAEPWDIAPVPEAVPIAQVIRPVETQPAQSGPQLEHLESRLLQQIAYLESEIARQQAAVNRLTAPSIVEQPISQSDDSRVDHVPQSLECEGVPDTSAHPARLPVALRPIELATPIFHLATKPLPIRGEVSTELKEVVQKRSPHRDKPGGVVSEAEPELPGVQHETNLAAARRLQSEQELIEREFQCQSRESELVRREDELRLGLARLHEQDVQHQSDAATFAEQLAALQSRERALESFSNQVEFNRQEVERQFAELDHSRHELERQQAEFVRREQNWRLKLDLLRSHAIAADIDREAAAAAEARRTEALDRKQSDLQCLLEDLHTERQSVEDSSSRLQQEHEQSAATRTSLEQWRVELDQLQQALHQQREVLDARESAVNARNQELTTLERACQVEVADLRNQQARLQAETNRIETWQHELTRQQAALDARSIAFEEHAAKLIAEQSQLDHEQNRLVQWSSELERQQASISRERQELQSQIREHELRSDELQRRTGTVDEFRLKLQNEQAVLDETRQRVLDEQTRVTLASEQLASEQSRLTEWQARLELRTTELSQREAAVIQQQQELDVGLADLKASRRTAAEEVAAGSATLNAEQLQLETLRQELFLAECEIEEVEADLAELEQQLQSREAELDARDDLLQQAECHVAWLQREHELRHTGTENQSSPQWHDQELDELATHISGLTDEYDALACELFVQSNLIDDQSRDASEYERQLRIQAAELEQQIQACHIQRTELDAERLAALQQYEQWRIERQDHEVELERCQSTLTDKLRALEIEWTNLQSQREEFNVRRDELEVQRAFLIKQQADFAVQQSALNAQRVAAAAQQQELFEQRENLNAQRSALDLERQTFAEDFERFQCQQAELIRQQELLDEKQRQLESRCADHEAALAAHVAERTAWEAEVVAARHLSEPLDKLASDSHEVATPGLYYHDSRVDEEELELLRKYSPALLNSEQALSQVLDQVSHLEHLVRDELAHESHPYETVTRDEHARDDVSNQSMDTAEDTIETPEAPQQSQPFESEQPGLTSVYGGIDTANSLEESRPRSIWSDETASDHPTEDPRPLGAVAEDHDPSVRDLRARLSEMFQFNLNDQPRHEGVEAEEREQLDPTSMFATPDVTRSNEPASVKFVPQTSFVETPSAEPEADEFDSVESYMQRLLDRNRRARGDEEPVPQERHMAPPEPAIRTIPESVQTGAQTEAAPVSETPSEPLRALVPREPVDMQKVREGLVNLRQVANVSARSAVARSKWNKMRTRVAVQCVCLVGCWLVGAAILSGKLTGTANVASWGWSAIALGFGIAVHAVGEVSSIFRNNQVIRDRTE